ncbi:MAG: hypothetical protein ACR2NP_08820 [Pirellulaceae bacterium]
MFVACLILAVLADEAVACPNCKNAVAQSGGSAMAAGFAWSIALLLAVPASIIAGWVIALRRMLR